MSRILNNAFFEGVVQFLFIRFFNLISSSSVTILWIPDITGKEVIR